MRAFFGRLRHVLAVLRRVYRLAELSNVAAPPLPPLAVFSARQRLACARCGATIPLGMLVLAPNGSLMCEWCYAVGLIEWRDGQMQKFLAEWKPEKGKEA